MTSGCGTHRAPKAIADDLVVCVPSDTVALAGVHLARVRTTPLYAALPTAWQAFLEPLAGATDVLIAWNGRDVLLIAQGSFPSPPPGAVLVSPTLALIGPPAAVQAATAQRKTGRTGVPELLAHAALAAPGLIWLAVEGRTALPLTGNFANVNRVLRLVDYATLTLDLDSRVDLRLHGVSHSAEEARQLEESLRALVSLAAASARDADVAALLKSIQVMRDGAAVEMAASASVTALEKLLR